MLDREEVRKALERKGRRHRGEMYGCIACYHGDPCDDRLLEDAARAFVDGRLIDRQGNEHVCPGCNGEGYWEEANPLPGYSPGPAPMTCPYCKGSGNVLLVAVGEGEQ
jgi:hypothetical protein